MRLRVFKVIDGPINDVNIELQLGFLSYPVNNTHRMVRVASFWKHVAMTTVMERYRSRLVHLYFTVFSRSPCSSSNTASPSVPIVRNVLHKRSSTMDNKVHCLCINNSSGSNPYLHFKKKKQAKNATIVL